MPLRPLPAQTTSFVGRTAELALLKQSFASGARLVTLLGPPGMGKSRLALRFAELARREGAFPGGTALCDLVDASGADAVCAALGRAIDVAVSEAAAGDRVEELGAALARLGEALVILDNAEGAVEVGPDTIGRWLRRAPELRLLTTSRVRLRLSGEVVHELGPLPLPSDEGDPGASPAAQLFLERARAARPGFALTPENAAGVSDLVRQLDGIPLALELGASRMGVLGPTQLLALLPRRLDVLSARLRDAAARQGTLREAIDASWGLLEGWEQAALAQLSVFRGGFGLEAAEAVVALPRGAPPLLDVLASLSDKSWLFTRPARADDVRFGLYLSIRDYAAERLAASGDAQGAAARHAAFFLGVAAAALEDGSADTPAGLERLALEQDNLTAAHRALLSSGGGAEGALRIALALSGVLSRWGPIATVISLLDEALGAGGRERAAPALLRQALTARSRAAHRLARLPEARAGYEQALALAQEAGDRRVEGLAAVGLGEVLREEGRLAEAERRLRQGVALLQADARPMARLVARACNALGHAYLLTGHPTEARAQHELALRLLATDPDVEAEGVARVSLGLVALAERSYDEAAALLAAPAAHGDAERAPPFLEAARLGGVAFMLHEQGRLAEAEGAAEAALAVSRKLGNRRVEGFSFGQIGLLHLETGDLAAAEAPLDRGAALLHEAGDARAGALFLTALAAAKARLGKAPEAARVLARADELLAAVGDPMLGTALGMYRAEVQIATAARAGEAAEAAAVEAAERRIADALGEGGAPEAPAPGSAAACSYHVRIALRILRQGLAARARSAPAPASSAAPAPASAGAGAAAAPQVGPPPQRGGALIIAPDARWCRLPDGRELTFQRARAQRLILLRLLEERLRAPGHALPVPALFESGWPGERASEEAAQNRVYVAVSRLRKLGFQGLILSRDDGFLLDPGAPTYRAERPV